MRCFGDVSKLLQGQNVWWKQGWGGVEADRRRPRQHRRSTTGQSLMRKTMPENKQK